MSSTTPPASTLDFAALRERLAAQQGREYWRSLDELAETPEFLEYLEREFPRQAGEWHPSDNVGRRQFLKLMAASLALAGAVGCKTRQPPETIVPYVRAPEEVIPGKPLYFATAIALHGYGLGLLAESHMGRPTKIEGNPEHPASLGATDIFAQASVLTLYDPERSQSVMYRDQISTWERFLLDVGNAMAGIREKQGRGLRILTGTVTSPTLAEQLQGVLKEFPEARWHQYEPLGRDQVRAGAKLAFGEYVDTVYHFDKAEVILAIDGDFLSGIPGSVRYAREFINGRRVVERGPQMNRLYALESTPTLTGAMADHRLPLRASLMESALRALARKLGLKVDGPDEVEGVPAKWLATVADDLRKHAGQSLVFAGDEQAPVVHALAHAINRELENVGQTLTYIEPVAAQPVNQVESLKALVDDLRQSRVELLVMLDGNPVYNAPPDLEFSEQLSKAHLVVHLSDYYDETSFLSHWHVPAAHYLERWGDVRAHDGTASVVQPLIAPLYSGKTAHDVLAAVAGSPDVSAYELVKTHWRNRLGEEGFGKAWRKVVHDGVVSDTAASAREVSWKFEDPGYRAPEPLGSSLEVLIRPDPSVGDGSFTGNGWLQELPKFFSKLVWENAAMISPRTAERLGLQTREVVTITTSNGSTLDVPIWIEPGHADESMTLTLGYGRSRAGRIGTNIGYNAYLAQTADARYQTRANLKKTGRRHELISTQNPQLMEGRDPVRTAGVRDLEDHPDDIIKGPSKEAETLPSLYADYPYPGNAWGMVIDETACIGCNACVIACQAENNIPIVGKDQVAVHREMHWIRIDHYYHGDMDNPDSYFQPLPCMHCETAPCELVCPVGATVHDAEGLNNMVYNRCIGTRYCSNNCPYKVRRFNFLAYGDEFQTPGLELLNNPDVTVRSRGVMEKCSYCVQRINAGRIQAKIENREIADGEVVTACSQVCPSQAITFGNLNDAKSAVRKQRNSPLNYSVLAELNTQPRTTYLARIRNPHPDLAEPQEPHAEKVST
ncbi:MAG TPA: TAT-variant-translocated molybdopterin oxidoreductase [Planctomycetaceae bacterium]|nr:TAT-variant-translocated molybdopterin oxidoreductase [Planctomycetaceae bacterium]